MGKLSKAIRMTLVAVGAATLALIVMTGGAVAQQQRSITGESYVPGVWVDPDGCEHWVMDDGWEGYMSTKRDREGNPVCRRVNLCGVVNADQLFATNRHSIGAAGRKRLTEFFNASTAWGFIVTGHTDSRASDGYNMRLSQRRAAAVARIGADAGARIIDVRGYGERKPLASNASAAGRQQNRRVEILCISRVEE